MNASEDESKVAPAVQILDEDRRVHRLPGGTCNAALDALDDDVAMNLKSQKSKHCKKTNFLWCRKNKSIKIHAKI